MRKKLFDMEQFEELYKKGFNQGYLIAKHEPELSNQLIKVRNPDNEYFEGFRLGKKEYEREKMKEQLKEQQNTKERSNDKER